LFGIGEDAPDHCVAVERTAPLVFEIPSPRLEPIIAGLRIPSSLSGHDSQSINSPKNPELAFAAVCLWNCAGTLRQVTRCTPIDSQSSPRAPTSWYQQEAASILQEHERLD
jgi:hypothetical protein